jgi:hypothetical protein
MMTRGKVLEKKPQKKERSLEQNPSLRDTMMREREKEKRKGKRLHHATIGLFR